MRGTYAQLGEPAWTAPASQPASAGSSFSPSPFQMSPRDFAAAPEPVNDDAARQHIVRHYAWPSLSRRQSRPHARSQDRPHGWLAGRYSLRGTGVSALAGVVGAVAYLIATSGGESSRHMVPLSKDLEPVAIALGFGLEQASVEGARFTDAADVLDALRLDRARTLFGLDVSQATRRIEALPWVRKAEISRLYPGEVQVRVHERRAFAVWRAAPDHLHLIDAEGRKLSATNARMAPNLPLITGAGAPARVGDLMTMLSSYPVITERFKSADWVADRRWRINLLNGTQIELPGGRASTALTLVGGQTFVRKLVAQPNRLIDLRAPGRIAVRPVPGASLQSSSPMTIDDLMKRGG